MKVKHDVHNCNRMTVRRCQVTECTYDIGSHFVPLDRSVAVLLHMRSLCFCNIGTVLPSENRCERIANLHLHM